MSLPDDHHLLPDDEWQKISALADLIDAGVAQVPESDDAED